MPLNFAAAFSGSNNLSISNYVGSPAAFSVACWVNLNTSQTSRIFFSNYNGSNCWAPGISDSVANKLKFFLGSNTLTSATTLASNVWYQTVFTWDGTTAKIYINGNTTPDATLTSGVAGSAGASNWIGSLNGSSQQLIGWLAGMGYWSKALSTTEVTSLYNSGQGLAGADLSGSLLTSLGSYQDFSVASSLGADSSGNGHTFTNNGAVVQAIGPASSFLAYSGRTQRPYKPVVQGRWVRGLVRSQVCPNYGANVFPDTASNVIYPLAGTMAWTRNQWGPCLQPNDSTGQGCINLVTPIAGGATEFTLSTLALLDMDVGGQGGIRSLWSAEGASVDMHLTLTNGLLNFAVNTASFPTGLAIGPPPLNTPVVITVRLTTAGVRSIWYGPYKVAERTDAGISWGSSSGSLGLGSDPTNTTRNWSGQINGGHVWNWARPDAEIVALASDFFAPVRRTKQIPGLSSSLSGVFFRRTLYDRVGSRGVQ